MRLTATAALVLGCAAAIAPAGQLNPSSAPASTMLPLNQVEPRTAITSIPTTISTSGSYFLVSNLTGSSGNNGITVAADNVTIDLRGFTLLGVGGSLDGITVTGDRFNIRVTNGVLRTWGSDGINATNADNSQFDTLRISNCGENGLMTGLNCNVVAVDVQATDTGITVDSGSTVERCTSASNTVNGIVANFSCRILDCTARNNTEDGFRVESGSIITHCTAGNNAGDGIEALGGATVLENTCDSQDAGSNTAGIRVTDERNHIEGNALVDNTVGIDIDGTINVVIRNTDTSDNAPFAHQTYIGLAGNRVGEVLSGTGTLTSTNSYANLTF